MPFDESYELLADLYADKSYPKKLNDKLKNHLRQAISAIEAGQREPAKVQKILAKTADAAAKLAGDYRASGCDPDAVREILAADILYVLDWFEVDLDVLDVLGEM